jgi:type I thyroxine 5'-deiodinase
VFEQPKTEDERIEVASACALHLNLAMPMALDDMDNTVDTAYAALPERLYLIDGGGRIIYRSGPGPWGFDVDAWEKAIGETVGAS